jgi:hypothetical protein
MHGRFRIAFETGKQLFELHDDFTIAGKYRIIGALDPRQVIIVQPAGEQQHYFLESRVTNILDHERFAARPPIQKRIEGMQGPFDLRDLLVPVFRPGDSLVVEPLHREPPYETSTQVLFHDKIEAIFVYELQEGKVVNKWKVKQLRFNATYPKLEESPAYGHYLKQFSPAYLQEVREEDERRKNAR